MAFNDLFGGKYKSQFNLDSQFGLITGVTKDDAGAPLASSVVKCFRTSTSAFVSQAISNGSGVYRLNSPFGAACFAVAYKAGAPDVAGTTVNTLVGVGGY